MGATDPITINHTLNLGSDGAVATTAADSCRLGQLHPMGFASLVPPQSVALPVKFLPARFGRARLCRAAAPAPMG
jgi:hypothetical protein